MESVEVPIKKFKSWLKSQTVVINFIQTTGNIILFKLWSECLAGGDACPAFISRLLEDSTWALILISIFNVISTSGVVDGRMKASTPIAFNAKKKNREERAKHGY